MNKFAKQRKLPKVNGKAEVEVPSLTHGLPPTPRERRVARRKTALDEAMKSMEQRAEREKDKG